MTLTATALKRVFRYNSVVLPDPGAQFSVEQVRDLYADTYPEITSAAVEGPEEDGDTVTYTFRRAVGTKGGEDLIGRMVSRFLGWPLPHDFGPDSGIVFDHESIRGQPLMWPTGTNLFNAEQARKMFEHALAGETALQPNSCVSRAEPGEPTFALLGRDRHAAVLVHLWAVLRELDGEDPDVWKEADRIAQEMVLYNVERGRTTVGTATGLLAAVLDLVRVANHSARAAKARNAETDIEYFRSIMAILNTEAPAVAKSGDA